MSAQFQKGAISKSMMIWTAILLLIAGIVTAQFFYGKQTTLQSPDQFYGTFLQTPRDISAFALTDQKGAGFTQQNLQNKWTFVFFGFTSCETICPTTLAQLNDFYKRLEQSNISMMPQIVFISVDPERDTPKKIKNYLQAFNSNFIGVTGKQEQLDPLARELGIAYVKIANQKNSNPEDYNMEHSGAIMLFNPQGKLQAFFTSPHDVKKMAEDYLRLVG